MELKIVFIDFIIVFVDVTFAFVGFDTISEVIVLGGMGICLKKERGRLAKKSLKTTDVDKCIRYEEMKVK